MSKQIIRFLKSLIDQTRRPEHDAHQTPELLSGRQLSGERATYDDIAAAYRLLLNRCPDPEGWNHFTGLVDTRISVEDLAQKFLNSEEYRKKTAAGDSIVPVDLDGYSVCIRPNEMDFGKHIYQSHQYEPHVRATISELLREGQTFIDIGANVGAISFHAAKIVGPTGRVVAIEPNPDNLQLLYAGIVYNGFQNIRVLPYAASNERAFFSLTGGTSNTYLIPPSDDNHLHWYTQSVVLDEELANIPAIDFIKIDIEGHEPRALAGFAKLIQKHRPILLTEFNPQCLSEKQQVEPIEYLRQLFTYYTKLHVTTSFGDSLSFSNAEDIMCYWQKRNAEISAEKILPDGILHFDIIATSE